VGSHEGECHRRNGHEDLVQQAVREALPRGVGADDVEVLVASGVAGCPDGGVQVVDVGEVGSVGSSVMWWVRTTLASGPAAAEGLPFIVGAAVWAVSAEGVVSDEQRADPGMSAWTSGLVPP